MYQLVGPAVDFFGQTTSTLLGEMQRLIAAGIDPTDEKLKRLKTEFEQLNADAVLRDLADATRIVNTEAALFGKGFESAPIKIQAVQAAINELVRQGTDPASASLRELTRQFDELQVEDLTTQFQRQQDTFLMTERQLANYNAQLRLSADALPEVRAQVEQTSNAMVNLADQQRLASDAIGIAVSAATQLGDALYDALTGQSESFAESVKQIIHSLNKMILQMIIAEIVARSLKAALSYFGTTGDTGTAVGAGTTTAGADILRSGSAAKGGIVKARTGGSLFIVGEGGQDEAIIPLDRMNALGGGGDVTVINEIHNHTDAQVTTNQRRGPDGKVINEIIIKMVTAAVGDGVLDPVMSASYGLKRRGVAR